MKAKFYRRKDRDDRFVVYLYWRGERYYRTYYDDNEPLSSKRLATRITEAVNADIEVKGKSFDPRVWFKQRGADFNFKNYGEKWLIKNLDKYAPSSRRQMNNYIEYAISFLGNFDIREIRYGMIEDYLESMPDTWSLKTKKNYLIALHKVFSDAFTREEIPRIPGFPRVSCEEKEIKWLERDWQDKIIEAIPDHDRPIFIFIRTYGCRPGEARALQWDCVDFEKKIIIIRRTFSATVVRDTTKTHRIRYLPMSPEIEEVLKKIRGISGFVFRNAFGRHYTPDISRRWNESRDRVGAPEVNMYQGTRHSLGTQLINDGVPLEFISKLFGHTNPEMTRRYAKVSLDTLRKILEPKKDLLTKC